MFLEERKSLEAWFWKAARRHTAVGEVLGPEAAKFQSIAAVMVCLHCHVTDSLASLPGDKRKPPDGKSHAADTVTSFHICDHGFAKNNI